MIRPRLSDDRDRAEWLTCLTAAAATCSEASGEHSGNFVLELADLYFHEFRDRCGE
jgi:hypothetical protein